MKIMRKTDLFLIVAIISFLIGVLTARDIRDFYNIKLMSRLKTTVSLDAQSLNNTADAAEIEDAEPFEPIDDAIINQLSGDWSSMRTARVNIIISYKHIINRLVKIVNAEKSDNRDSVVRKGEALLILSKIASPELLPFLLKNYDTPRPTGITSGMSERINYPARTYVNHLLYDDGTKNANYFFWLIVDYLKKEPPENIDTSVLIHYKNALLKVRGPSAEEYLEIALRRDPANINLKRVLDSW